MEDHRVKQVSRKFIINNAWEWPSEAVSELNKIWAPLFQQGNTSLCQWNIATMVSTDAEPRKIKLWTFLSKRFRAEIRNYIKSFPYLKINLSNHCKVNLGCCLPLQIAKMHPYPSLHELNTELTPLQCLTLFPSNWSDFDTHVMFSFYSWHGFHYKSEQQRGTLLW